MIKKIIIVIFFLIGLIYLILPSPQSVNQFANLTGAVRSNLHDDTWFNPNIAAYLSDHNRDFVTSFYQNNLTELDPLGAIFPPMRLNHPVEDAFQDIHDQQKSTFLEEYIYPFRESLYVNGYEPKLANRGTTNPNNYVIYNGINYSMKSTVRLYPTNIWARVLIYLGIWGVLFWLYKLFYKARKEKFA